MFNNANVIFRTKFVDGLSTVTRSVPALKDKEDNTRPDAPNALAAAAAKRRAPTKQGKEN
jgi:structural maintenance of chromosome 2